MKTIYVDVDDEITSVIDKIKKEAEYDIALVIPKRAVLSQSIVNLKLLKRQAGILGKKIVIVPTTREIRAMAEKVGLVILKDAASQKEEERKEAVFAPHLRESKKPLESKISRILKEKIKKRKEKKARPRPVSEEKKMKVSFQESGKIKRVSISDIVQRIKERKREGLGEEKMQGEIKEPERDIQRIDQSLDQQKKEQIDSFLGQQESRREIQTSRKRKFFPSLPSHKVLLPRFLAKILFIFFVVSSACIAIIAFFVLPKAQIKVAPKTEPMTSEFDLVIDEGSETVDLEAKRIPGQLVTIEEESEKKKFEATGQKDIGNKAEGEVVIFNKFSSDPQRLVKGMRFVTSEGKVFNLTNDTEVPGAEVRLGKTVPGKTKAILSAESPGVDYNIEPSHFTILDLPQNQQKDIYAESESNFSGGTSKMVKIVSEENINKAKNQLSAETTEKVLNKFYAQAEKESKMFFKDTLVSKELEVKTDAEVGSEKENFEMQLKLAVSTLLFEKKSLSEVILNYLEAQIPQEKFLTNESLDEGISFKINHFDIQEKKEKEEYFSKIAARVTIKKKLAYRFDEERLKRDLVGKTKEEAEKIILGYPNIVGAEVSFWPFWVKKVPYLEKKIEIGLDLE